MKCHALFTPKINDLMLFATNEWSINTNHAKGRFRRQQIDDIFLIFPRKIGSDSSCKLSPFP